MKSVLVLWFYLVLLMSYSQSFDDVISSNRYVDCRDVSFNALSIIGDLYAENNIDKILEFLDYWESKCGAQENIVRLRTILDIRERRFEIDSINESTLNQLLSYRRELDGENFTRFYIPAEVWKEMQARQSSFDSLTQKIARNSTSIQEDESLILDFYSSETPTFTKTKSATSESRLRSVYVENYRKTLSSPELHLAFVTGVSQHYGSISLFGIRPNFGVVFGGKQLRHNYDLILDFRAGPSKEEYTFEYQGSLVTEDTWTGMYFGAEYTFDFIHREHMNIGISPGIGYDRLTALTTENDFGEDPKFLSSFNRNIGLVFKFRFGNKGAYFGLHCRYNWADYDNPGGTRLDGEYLNIRLTVGSIFDYWRNEKLKLLE
ncbi:MAG: hypothetical protein AAF789_05505 [Bacteroidota bacterium]